MKAPLGCAAAILLLALAQQQPPAPPTFRTGTNLVRVDVTVTDRRGSPVTTLTADDFEVREDGAPQAITSFKLVEASGVATDGLSLPIRGPEHARAEAARDDVRLFLIFWDEYHIEQFRSARFAREAFQRIMLDAFGPTDLVGIMDQLTPTDAIRFTRDRRALYNQIHGLKGRRFIYVPVRSLVEEEHARMARRPGDIEIFRGQVTRSAIQAAATFLGTLREGPKNLIIISESLGPFHSSSDQYSELGDLIRAANDSNTSIFVFDPRGLTIERNLGSTLDDLARGTGGRPVRSNDAVQAFGQIVKESSAFYLLGYTREIPHDGKFHQIKVQVKRPGLEVRARSGYWAPRLAEVTTAKATAAAAVLPPEIEAAFASLTPSHARQQTDLWVGTTFAGGRAQATVAWTPREVRDDAVPPPDSVTVVAKAAGRQVFDGAVAPTGTSFDVPPGPLELAVSVRDHAGEVVDRFKRKITVADPAASLALSTPLVVLARNPREQRALESMDAQPVHAGRDFARTDRAVVRFETSSDAGSVRALLLNRRGERLLELPVTPDATHGGYEIVLPLSGIARGEYAVTIRATRGEAAVEAHLPFRITR